MPYIEEDRREVLTDYVTGGYPETVGELNFLITNSCINYIDYLEKGDIHGYSVYNEVVGALECAKQEFYRRMVVPYEDKKIQENGDVY